MKLIKYTLAVLSVLVSVACDRSIDIVDEDNCSYTLTSTDELKDFTVVINTSPLSEKESVPSNESNDYYNYYIENGFKEKVVTSITFDGNGKADVKGLSKEDTIDVNNGSVVLRAHSHGLTLKVSGATSDGSIKVFSENKFCLKLNGASITNPSGPAVNIQKGSCYLVTDGTNTLTDKVDAEYSGSEGGAAVLFSNDDIYFSGSGSLNVSAYNNIGKDCITCGGKVFMRPGTNIYLVSKAYAGHGINAGDAVVIKGGVLNIITAGDGKHGVFTNGNMLVDGGRTTILNNGAVAEAGSSEPKGCAAIECEGILNIDKGLLHLKSSRNGGKGISAGRSLNISSGDLFIITEGAKTSPSVVPDAISCEGNITISGGNTCIRATGADAVGIDCEGTLTFTGGHTAVSSYGDGINASNINISGGRVFSMSTNEGDGIDSNGSVSATGGILIGIAGTNKEKYAILYNTLNASNSTVIGISEQTPCEGQMNGCFVKTNIAGFLTDYLSLFKGKTPLVTFRLTRIYKNGQLLLSTPTLTPGHYLLKTGVYPSGENVWMNYLEKPSGLVWNSYHGVTAE